jgi:hypothetical protein
MSDQRFLGICIVAGSIILGAAILVAHFFGPQPGHYQAAGVPGAFFLVDTRTGDFIARDNH